MKLIKLSLVSMILILILACAAFNTTPAEETEAVPATSANPTDIPPTSTASPVPPTATPEVRQFFTEDFQGEYSDNWSHFLRNGDEDKFSLTATSDGLIFELTGRGIFSYLVYEPFEYDEVRIDATFENMGVNDNNITLFCRYSVDAGWYEFNIYSSGLYDMFFTKPDPAGNLNYGLIAEGGSNKIKMGHAVNTYSAVCRRDALILYINGVETRKVGLPAYVLEGGKVGVSVSSFSQVPVKVLVSEVEISEP